MLVSVDNGSSGIDLRKVSNPHLIDKIDIERFTVTSSPERGTALNMVNS